MKTGQIVLAGIAGLVGIGLMVYATNDKFKLWVDDLLAGEKYTSDGWED